MAERLKDATSPYLLQHAGNPVDWWPWSDGAFEEARARDVPVLLSVGYAACHWCHVMAHESFEDPATAAMLNESFVPIKVDREERPDVDAVYMAATQAMTGQGGWPMTVFMTPDREPFYCGTYFPRDYFQRLMTGIARAWRDERPSVANQARQIAGALAERAAPWQPAGGGEAGPAAAGGGGISVAGLPAADEAAARLAGVCDRAVGQLAASYDRAAAGFGQAPKFPPSMVCEFLLRHSERPGAAAAGQALAMVKGTARAMAGGGMYDQIGGGFARYSVDDSWVIPHFEKMLYDNALLARVYAHLWRRAGDPLARRVARETCEWLIRELRTDDGGFASALDADSDGEEGLFYTWTPAELREVLGDEDGDYAARQFGVTEAGTFEGGRSVLMRPDSPQAGAAWGDRLEGIAGRLLAAREGRVRPARDDKVVTAWNGLAIAALAECGLLLGEPSFTQAAVAAASLLGRVHVSGGRVARVSRAGVAGPSAGILEDYACLADGLLVLSGVTGTGHWAGLAGQLLETALARFSDGNGGFYDTADDGEALIYRPADPADGPTPSGTFALVSALVSYGALTGSARHRDAAAAALAVLGPISARFTRAAGAGLAAAEAILAGPAEVAIVGPPDDPRTADLHRAAMKAAPPGAVFALGDGRTADDGVPLLAGRGLVAGSPAAYICRNFTCRTPVTDIAELAAALSYPAS